MMIELLSKNAICVLAVLFLLAGCGGDSDDNQELADIRVYKSDSAYRNVIADCARAAQQRDYCTFETLPLLGMEYNDPGIPQIMDRVVVSNEWMGMRFEELLYEMPDAMLPLFRGVTAIVLNKNTRPAFYSTATGAIYLDPAFMWLTVEEKRTINPKEDYRAGFDDPLAFRQLQRYVKDGQQAYRWGSLTDNSTREMDDIVLLVARLLLHELAHANDFLPPSTYDSMDPTLTVSEAASAVSDEWISTRLSEITPLSSDTMFSLADVMYGGTTPVLEDLEITASEVGVAFEPDGAADDYGYTTQFEDTAMLFETAMMKLFFNADYEIAFTNVPENPSFCDSYQIGWGVRNRVGDDNVRDRAKFVSENLMPHMSLDTFFSSLDPATEISGDWCLSTTNQFELQKIRKEPINIYDIIPPYQ